MDLNFKLSDDNAIKVSVLLSILSSILIELKTKDLSEYLFLECKI